jgi:hypothetical protein
MTTVYTNRGGTMCANGKPVAKQVWSDGTCHEVPIGAPLPGNWITEKIKKECNPESLRWWLLGKLASFAEECPTQHIWESWVSIAALVPPQQANEVCRMLHDLVNDGSVTFITCEDRPSDGRVGFLLNVNSWGGYRQCLQYRPR